MSPTPWRPDHDALLAVAPFPTPGLGERFFASYHMQPGAAAPAVPPEEGEDGGGETPEGADDSAGTTGTPESGFELATVGSLDEEDFDEFVRDTTNFLAYIGEPIRSFEMTTVQLAVPPRISGP